MNKVKLSMVALSTLFLIGCEGDDVLTTPTTNNLTTPTTNNLMTPDYNYEIDTWGSNSQIYEFTPKSHKGKSCVILKIGVSQTRGLQCFDKGE